MDNEALREAGRKEGVLRAEKLMADAAGPAEEQIRLEHAEWQATAAAAPVTSNVNVSLVDDDMQHERSDKSTASTPVSDPEEVLQAWSPRKDRIRAAEQPAKKTKLAGPGAVNSGSAERTAAASTHDTAPATVTPTSAGLFAVPAAKQSIARPAVFTDERRRSSLMSMKIPKRPAPGPSASTSTSNGPFSPQATDENDGLGRPPKWYNDTPRPTTRIKKNADSDSLLQSLSNEIKRFREQSIDSAVDLRDRLHKIVFQHVTGPLLRRYRLLDNETGLPSIFDPRYNKGLPWPFDVRADAEELYNKWARKVFETDILRGIKDGSIKPGYQVNAKYFGNGDLLNGQWWPTQICVVRDGAHGSPQAGISAAQLLARTAVSWQEAYCGTDSADGSLTTNTQCLITSITSKKPVRLIRSQKLGGKWAPEVGYRYDGLYDVTDVEELDPPGRRRYTLVRCPGQDLIRGGNGPERRPTQQEEAEYHKSKK